MNAPRVTAALSGQPFALLRGAVHGAALDAAVTDARMTAVRSDVTVDAGALVHPDDWQLSHEAHAAAAADVDQLILGAYLAAEDAIAAHFPASAPDTRGDE